MRLHLEDAQRNLYRHQGYLVLQNAASSEEVSKVRAVLERLFSARAGSQNGDFLDLAGTDEDPSRAALPQILMPVKYAPELDSCGLRDTASEIATQLLGEGVEYQGEHAIMKPPYHGAETALHQDEAFWSESTEYESLSVWFPLQDVSDENGCISFIPGSHLEGVLRHRSVDGDARKNGLEVENQDGLTVVPIALAAGGATVHHCRTIHGAGRNRTAQARLALIFGFGLPGRPSKVQRDFYWLKEKKLLREERARTEGFELTKMRPEL